MTRLLAILAILVASLGAPAVATAQELPDECRSIVGCPDAGPEPEHSGDRGGWAQLLTLGVMVVAVAFILTKVLRAARGQAATPGAGQPGS